MLKNDFYKGSIEALLLQLIEQAGETYGYELTQKALAYSEGKLKITEGTLYPLLHKLEAQGILESEVKPYGNRSRKYYRLTKEGKKEQSKSLEQLKDFMIQMQQFLTLKPFKNFINH
ncbi:MAG TPA: PadR family transcriptional regulator [Edaphocola sp.]|nr:PadR family transcriptional regulator [Edaphocola sp.]